MQETGSYPNFSTSDIVLPGVDAAEVNLPKFSPEELIGVTFLKDTDHGQRVRAKIVQKINDLDALNHQNIKMIVKYGDDDVEEIMAYTELCDIVEDQINEDTKNPDQLWFFKEVIGHSGPLKPSDPEYKGCQWNVRVRWEDGSESDEPLSLIIKDDPVSIAQYAKEYDLLEVNGWKRLKPFSRRVQKLERLINQAKLSQAQRTNLQVWGSSAKKQQGSTHIGCKKWQY